MDRTAALCFIMACAGCSGAASRPEAPDPEPGPRTVKLDSSAALDALSDPRTAVFLGTDLEGRSTLLELGDGGEREAALFVDGAPIRVGLSAAAKSDARLEIGVSRGDSRSLALLRVAAEEACRALGIDLSAYTIRGDFRSETPVTMGSMALAVGLMAAMTDAPLLSDAAVLGEINPDGSLSLAHVSADFAALPDGLRAVGYPEGDGDAAEKLGERGVPIANVADAYELMTGTALPRTVPLSDEEVAFSSEAEFLLRAAIDEWRQKLRPLWAEILQLQNAGHHRQKTTAQIATATGNGTRAERLMKLGEIAAAYGAYIEAVRDGRIALRLIKLEKAQGQETWLATLRAPELTDGILDAREAHLKSEPTAASLSSLGRVLASVHMRDEIETLVDGMLEEFTKQQFSPGWREKLRPVVADLIASQETTRVELVRDAELRSLDAGSASAPDDLDRLADRVFLAATSQQILAVDSGLTRPRSPRRRIALANNQRVWAARIRRSPDHALAVARRGARQHAHRAKIASGSVPTCTVLHYRQARQFEKTAPRRALEHFWHSTSCSRLAIDLALARSERVHPR